MKLLDTREQKSPRFLTEAFPEIVECVHLEEMTGCNLGVKNCPFMDNWADCSTYRAKGLVPLKSGDYYNTVIKRPLEIKIGNDFGIHTEPLERMQDEFYRLRIWSNENQADPHAVWFAYRNVSKKEIKHFNSLCFQYNVWGHIVYSETELIQFIKRLDQPSQYIRDECFIKRDHTKVSILAKMIRQFPRISSEKAVELATRLKGYPITMWGILDKVYSKIEDHIISILGRKKDGTPTKLATDFIKYLEEGE